MGDICDKAVITLEMCIVLRIGAITVKTWSMLKLAPYQEVMCHAGMTTEFGRFQEIFVISGHNT